MQLILKWQQAGDQITWKSAQDKFDAMNATGHNPEYWKRREPNITEITAEIDKILTKTHGRMRTELRKRISNHCAVHNIALRVVSSDVTISYR